MIGEDHRLAEFVPVGIPDEVGERIGAPPKGRFRAHSMYDSDRYRDKAEIEHWKERDPVEGFATESSAC
ncbi:hypothetical protein ABZ770_40635 [Streptomyces sp. NPDC006654]|uniref:hypothetical protein n=1 Tax=Streptomyces sp. NPDC006654 TaxID=3156897 RepID=UPI0033E16FC9